MSILASPLSVAGVRTSGASVRTQNGICFYIFSIWSILSSMWCEVWLKHNLKYYIFVLVMAASSIANIVKSSLGPVGLDKMLVDDIGDVTVTNDGATILRLLEVEHPAARVLVELAQLQDEEVGDGTTSVVIIAAELLKVICFAKRFQFS